MGVLDRVKGAKKEHNSKSRCAAKDEFTLKHNSISYQIYLYIYTINAAFK